MCVRARRCDLISIVLCVWQVKAIFSRARGEVVCVSPPGDEERRKFFSELILEQAARAPPLRRHRGTLGPRGHLCCRAQGGTGVGIKNKSDSESL